MSKSPSVYEIKAKQQIWVWKNPKQTWIDKAVEYVSTPFEGASNAILNSSAVGDAVKKATAGILGVMNDFSQWTVRPEAIIAEYNEHVGVSISSLSEVYSLDLSVVDKTIGWLDSKYEGIALLEGAAAGATSIASPAAAIAAIPADIIALVTMNLRAIGEYATYCGFDCTHQEERLFALNVLAYSTSASDSSKQIALANLVKIAKDVAAKKTWDKLEEHLFVRAANQIASMFTYNITKGKLAQIIPYAGAVVGGGYNAYYTDKICKSAFYLYRERFLAEKYGDGEIEIIDMLN